MMKRQVYGAIALLVGGCADPLASSPEKGTTTSTTSSSTTGGASGTGGAGGGELMPPATGIPSIVDASVPDGASDELRVRFDRAVSADDARGFRLVGGASRIEALMDGSGTTELVFRLSDHALPDDTFQLRYWAELGVVATVDARLGSSEVDVVNEAQTYDGGGTVYYVAPNGDDEATGLSPRDAFASVEQALSKLGPGDYALLERGGTWNLSPSSNGAFRGHLELRQSGAAGAYLTLGAYGEGPRPKLVAPSGGSAALAVIDASFVAIDNLHVIADRGDYGIVFAGKTERPLVSNCLVEARDDVGGYGGIYFGATLTADEHVIAPQVLFNEVRGFKTNISSNGYDMSASVGRHRVLGGLIEGNELSDVALPDGHDGLKVARGSYDGIVVRKNHITGWLDDALETFGAEDIVVEFNHIHDPQPPNADLEGTQANHASQGIKAGGIDMQRGYVGRRVIVRYNHIHDLPYDAASIAIMGNGGKSGEIYGNVIHDVRNIGIKIDCQGCDQQGWRLHHNTVVGVGKDALQLYTSGDNASAVTIFNNILDGGQRDLHASVSSGEASGGFNLLAHGAPTGAYDGESDAVVTLGDLFVDLEARELFLTADAPAVDGGTEVDGYVVDHAGNPIVGTPDVGAFEAGTR